MVVQKSSDTTIKFPLHSFFALISDHACESLDWHGNGTSPRAAASLNTLRDRVHRSSKTFIVGYGWRHESWMVANDTYSLRLYYITINFNLGSSVVCIPVRNLCRSAIKLRVLSSSDGFHISSLVLEQTNVLGLFLIKRCGPCNSIVYYVLVDFV